MNRNIYCSRNGGATINDKFYPAPRVSEILERQIKRQTTKLLKRRIRRESSAPSRPLYQPPLRVMDFAAQAAQSFKQLFHRPTNR